MIRAVFFVAASILAAAPVLSQPMALPTGEFVKAAAQTDEFERQEGRLAAREGASPRVRDFGQMMVTDHTRTTEALKAALKKAGLSVPPPPALSERQTQDLGALRGLHGAAFDKAYLTQQIAAHQAALGVMQGYAASGENPVLRQAAANTVPVVRHHLEMAQQIQGG